MASAVCHWNELSLRRFGFYHDKPILFVTSQWSVPAWCYPAYKCVVMLYMVISLIYITATTDFGAKFLIFVSNWTYISLTLSSIIRFITACIHVHRTRVRVISYRKETKRNSQNINESQIPLSGSTSEAPVNESYGGLDNGRESNDDSVVAPESHNAELSHLPTDLPFSLKISWVLYNISNAMSITITVLYWSIDFDQSSSVTFPRFSIHSMNTLIILVDIMVTAFPVRLLHFYQSMIYGAIYMIFIVVYWASGGRGHHGHRYIYATVDFGRRPGLAVGLILCGGLVAPVIFHGLVFGLYKLRTKLLAKLCFRSCGVKSNSD